MDCDDVELVRRWQRGERAAFEALVRRWQGPVTRFLFRWTGRAESAHDLCQDVFLRAYLAGPRYRQTAAFSTWLYRIALNAARDAARRGRRQPAPLDNGEVPDPAPAAADLCDQRERAEMVARAVAELPEPLRLVLVLRHYEGMSFEDMARLTGTPASTLKSRFAAALARLRVSLQPLRADFEEIDR